MSEEADRFAQFHAKADTVLATFDAKMAAIDAVAARQRDDITKSLAPDFVKAEQVRHVEAAADDFRRQVVEETRTQIKALKNSPQPAKASVSEALIKGQRDPWTGLFK